LASFDTPNATQSADAIEVKPTFDALAILKDVTPSTVQVVTIDQFEGNPKSRGSGVFVSSGLENACEVATVDHVTKGDERIIVKAPDGLMYSAVLQLQDKANELAIYKLSGIKEADKVCKPVAVRTTDLELNELVLGVSDQLGPTVPIPYIGQSIGKIKRNEIDKRLPELDGENMQRDLGQLVTRFLPSDSGGAAFDSQRRIVGLMTAQTSAGIGAFELGRALQDNLDKLKALRQPK